MTSIQDRTAEFRACVTSMSRLNGQRPLQPRQPAAAASKSDFSLRASQIASEIAETTEMLQRLALLAKRKTLFNDRPVEITELTYVIKQKVSKINTAIADLQKMVKAGSQWGRKGEQQVSEHSKNVLVMLQGNLTDVTTGFAEVLETRTKNMQASKSRSEQFITSSAASASAAAAMAYAGDGARQDSPLYSTSTPTHSENPYDSLTLPEQSQQLLLEEQQGAQDTYLSQRSSAVDAIESTIQELGHIFGQLATMVAEQRETIQRIDANTEDISINVSGAHRELLKYYSRISSNRWLMVKMFGVILVFFFLWVLVS